MDIEDKSFGRGKNLTYSLLIVCFSTFIDNVDVKNNWKLDFPVVLVIYFVRIVELEACESLWFTMEHTH